MVSDVSVVSMSVQLARTVQAQTRPSQAQLLARLCCAALVLLLCLLENRPRQVQAGAGSGEILSDLRLDKILINLGKKANQTKLVLNKNPETQSVFWMNGNPIKISSDFVKSSH